MRNRYQIEALLLELEQVQINLKKSTEEAPPVSFPRKPQPAKVPHSGLIIEWEGQEIQPGSLRLADSHIMNPDGTWPSSEVAILKINPDTLTVIPDSEIQWHGDTGNRGFFVANPNHAFEIRIDDIDSSRTVLPLRRMGTHTVDADIHVPKHLNPYNQQRSLVHGLDLVNHRVRPPSRHRAGITEASVGVGASGAGWCWSLDGDPVYVKPGELRYASPQSRYGCHAMREVVFYNLAHTLGLGDHVPLTAAFYDPATERLFSAMRYAKGARHYDYSEQHDDILRQQLQDGTLHKLALMDFILSNYDRHHNSFMVSDSGIQLIDHGYIMDGGIDRRALYQAQMYRVLAHPAYMWPFRIRKGGGIVDYSQIAQTLQPFHSSIRDWLHSIDEALLTSQMEEMGMSPASRSVVRTQIERLRNTWDEVPFDIDASGPDGTPRGRVSDSDPYEYHFGAEYST